MNCKPGLCTSLLTFLQMEQSLSVQYLLTALINTLVKQTEQFLLVLDDYHVVTESAVHTSLIFLLEHLPSQLHIVEWVQFWLASGEVERVIGWAQELVQQPGEQSPLAREREDVARARILLAQKKPAEALSLLGPLHASAEQQERWNHVIEMKVLQALAHSMCDEEQEALAVLAQAMQLAEPEGYIRIFVDEGAPMASMLSRLREQEDKRVPTAYLDTLLATFHEIGTAYEQKPEREDSA